MVKPVPIRFNVRPEDEAAAIAHFKARGYSPAKIEQDDEGLVILIFSPIPNDQMYEFLQGIPAHLSAKIGIVAGDQFPFQPSDANDS